MQIFKRFNDAVCKQVQTISSPIHVNKMLRLRDYHGRFQGVQSKHSNRGAHFQKQKQIPVTFNDHNYFQTLPSDEEDVTLCVETETEWREGRRIVELGYLAKQLFCHLCKTPLHLKDTVRERRYGLGSVLHVQCTNCSAVCPVETGKRGPTGAFDINTKAALGMIHVGMGPTHLVNFLGQCNIPPPSEPSIRKHAAKVGKAITDVALESCRAAQVEEKQTSDTLQASFDGGWQKRGTGWNYNSISGHASMIGKNTGKILAYEVRSKCCRVCDLHAEQNHTVPSHDCPQNWSGSSKAMEADMAMSMAHQLADNDFMLQVLHADNDSATTAKIHLDFPNIVKKDDRNHVKKGISKYLYSISKRYYGGSSSLKRRVSAAVLQKNEGHSYLVKVNKASSLSPGVYTSSLTQKIDQRRRVKRLHQRSLQYKRRRIQLQKQKRKKERISTVREGVTYEPNLEFNCSVGAQEEIPKFLEFDHSCELVVFDLETTGLGRKSDITQIAACAGEESFQNYVIPRCNITSEASRLTGITFCRETNCMFLNGKPVSGEHIQDALLNFITFLQSKKSPVLIGHNIKSFDLHVLFNRLQEFNLFSTFCQTVRGFIDTLQLCRRVISKEEVSNCYKQEHLVKMLTGQTYAAHNALADVKSLQKLIELRLFEHISNSDYYSIMYHACMASYVHLDGPKKICKSVSEKLSRSGVSLQHVKLAISRDLKAAKMMLQTHKISCKQAENVVKILLCEE
nr:uncharacterized protein LOC105341150 isoform X2 [Crassostrea gigas]